MTVRELIAELRALCEQGFGDAQVLVRSDPFQLADMDADGEVKTFDAVLVLGVDFCGADNGRPYVILDREDPEVVRDRMVATGLWAMPGRE